MSMRGQMIQAYEVRIHESQLEPEFLTQGNNLRIGQWWCLVHRLAGFPSWMLFGDQQWNPKQKHNFPAWSKTTPVWDSFLVRSLLFLARPDRPAHHLIEISLRSRGWSYLWPEPIQYQVVHQDESHHHRHYRRSPGWGRLLIGVGETSAACEGCEVLRVKGWSAENGGQLTQQKGLDISGGWAYPSEKD